VLTAMYQMKLLLSYASFHSLCCQKS